MIHLAFLVSSFIVALLMQKLLLITQVGKARWKEKRGLHLVALSMPSMAFFLFSLLMLPEVFVSQLRGSHPQNWQQDLLWGGITLPLAFLLLSFVLNVVRLIWLSMRVRGSSWEVPAQLKEGQMQGYQTHFCVRLWYHTRPFAFLLPALWPRGQAVVVLSTALVERLDPEELQAVLWHETGHLCRQDFWITWLATWWRDAFFYLPSSWTLLEVLREAQEGSCDAWVAKVRGKQTALALASALLKVWEDLLEAEETDLRIAPRTLGLASEKKPSHLEQRVKLLVEQVEQQKKMMLRAMIAHAGTLYWLLLVFCSSGSPSCQ